MTTDETRSLGFVKIHIPVARRAADIDEKRTGFEDMVRYDQFVCLLFKQDTEPMMALHAALGVAGEAGELADVIKRQYIYNRQVTPEGKTIREGIVEELGDLRFYMQAVMNHYGISEQEVLNYNANKLSLRYKDLKYSDKEAGERADKIQQELSDRKEDGPAENQS